MNYQTFKSLQTELTTVTKFLNDELPTNTGKSREVLSGMSKEDGRDLGTPRKTLTKTESRWFLFSSKVHKVPFLKNVSTYIAISNWGKRNKGMIVAKSYKSSEEA